MGIYRQALGHRAQNLGGHAGARDDIFKPLAESPPVLTSTLPAECLCTFSYLGCSSSLPTCCCSSFKMHLCLYLFKHASNSLPSSQVLVFTFISIQPKLPFKKVLHICMHGFQDFIHQNKHFNCIL